MFNIFNYKNKVYSQDTFSDEIYEYFYKEKKELLLEIEMLEKQLKEKDKEIESLKRKLKN